MWFAHVPAGRLDDVVRIRLAADLDDATLTRLDRFRRPEDRDRGLAAHSMLRRLLAPIAGLSPPEIRLATRCSACGSTEHGKPELAGYGCDPPARFNLSHAGELVAVVITGPDLDAGIDVESRARRVDWAQLRRSIFTDAEWDATVAARDPARARMDAWSRKEAAVKATGHGLSAAMRSVAIDQAGSDLPRWQTSIGGPDGEWAVRGWDIARPSGVDREYAAAVAASPRRRPGRWPLDPEINDFRL